MNHYANFMDKNPDKLFLMIGKPLFREQIGFLGISLSTNQLSENQLSENSTETLLHSQPICAIIGARDASVIPLPFLRELDLSGITANFICGVQKTADHPTKNNKIEKRGRYYGFKQ